jgi:putative aldouronate transport system permease protein
MSVTKESHGDHIFEIVNYCIVTLFFLAVLYPLIYVLSCSISSPDLVATGKVIFFPKGVTLAGYKRVFQDSNILLGYKNTLFYTAVGTLINLFVTVPAGYALAKKELPGRNLFMYFFLFTMYFSGGMIPTFLLVKSLGLYNTRTILLILGAFNTYNCIICRTFFAAIPKELEEAAEIDGSSRFRTFLQIILPTSQALLGVMVLYFAVAHWNSYFSALMYVSDDKIKPLQLFLRKILILQEASSSMLDGMDDEVIAEQTKLRELIKYSVIVVSSLPVLILYPFLQKYFVQGIMIGSLKG